jgi:kumamolisin
MKFPVQTLCLGLLVGLGSSSLNLFAAEKAVMQGHVSATRAVGFEVYIPIQHRAQLEKDLDAMHNPGSPTYQRWLTPTEFHARYGASQKQLDEIKEDLESKGLSTTIVTGHHLHVTGEANSIEQAFGTRLETGVYKNGKTMVAATDAMAQVGAMVVGLANKMPMQTHSHISALPANRYSTAGPYWFTDLKQAYSFPSYKSLTGKGVTIATLVDGAYGPDDMTLYFSHEKLATPKFSEVNVDGGAPFDGDSFETNLDFQQAGGMAPGAKIVHYNIPDLSDNSIIDGLSQIVTDNVADVVSMSFGGAELLYTPEYNDGVDYTYLLTIEDDLMAQGNAQGITFVASSGDTGALSVPPLVCFTGVANCGVMRASVQFPASSPHVTAVGGTNLVTSYDGGATDNSVYVREEAFGDPLGEDLDYGTSSSGNYWGSGGGDSIIFKKPTAQTLIDTGNKKFRTVPDVAYQMGGCPGAGDPVCNPDDSADLEYFNGSLYGAIGTSAAAPDFAGLVALSEQRSGGRIGNANYLLYLIGSLQNAGVPLKAFNSHIPGFNGFYSSSAKPYNRVTGLGTLNGVDVLLTPNAPKAGTPQTPSNP